MCDFFSVISDGKGKIDFFTPEEVVAVMVAGNPNKYDFNSHTSLCHFKGITAKNEDKWNKWEYSPAKKELIQDSLVTTDDRIEVKKFLDKWFADKDVDYFRNLYGRNTGYNNTGHFNTGDRNTGHRNTGHRNTGDRNTGHWNTGRSNTGYSNTGRSNTGDRNTGYWNTGDNNTGHRNTGDRNTGDRNTGYNNTGHRNTGHWNTCNDSAGFFCTTADVPRLFNKPCSLESANKVRTLYFNLPLTEWIEASDMTNAEKEAHEFWETTNGYLKEKSYHEAWEIFAKKNPEIISDIKTWENFDAEIFKEITGLTV